METIECINSRVSVHKFKKKALSKSKLTKILTAGMRAPSAGNSQPWRFIVLDDEATIDRIAKATLQPEVFYNVPYVVVVCADTSKVASEFPKRGGLYAVQSVAAAIENMLLAATDAGIASIWIGAFADETVKAVLRIPQEIDVHAILPFGYSDGDTYRSARIATAHVTFFNKWNNRANQKFFFPLSKQVAKIKKKLSRKKK